MVYQILLLKSALVDCPFKKSKLSQWAKGNTLGRGWCALRLSGIDGSFGRYSNQTSSNIYNVISALLNVLKKGNDKTWKCVLVRVVLPLASMEVDVVMWCSLKGFKAAQTCSKSWRFLAPNMASVNAPATHSPLFSRVWPIMTQHTSQDRG